MSLDLKKYRRALHPTNVFEMLPRAIIEQMIRGFFFRIKKGVTLVWSEYDSQQARWVIKNDRVDPFSYAHPQDREFFNKVCWEYRQKRGDQDCWDCDRRIAQEYVDGTRERFEPHPCWLGMDDLAFPLRIGGKVWGVLFAGQIVPNDDARVTQIEANIRQRVNAPDAERLIQLVHEERESQWESDPHYSETLVGRLSEFGNMVQQILTQLYNAHRTAAEQEFLQSVETELASADLADADTWWSACDQLLRSVVELFGLEKIDIYS